jgi:hypothetical protein
MAHTHRFREGQMKLVKMPVASATVIYRCDMLFLGSSAGEVFPVSMHNWDASLAATQGVLAGVFMGIAYEGSDSGDTDDISVDVSSVSVYEFDVASSTYEHGATLGPDENGSTNVLMDQQLEAATGTSAIARACEKAAAAVTKLDVSFASAYITSSSNVNANIG